MKTKHLNVVYYLILGGAALTASACSETNAKQPTEQVASLTAKAPANKKIVPTLSPDLPFDVTITGSKLETTIRRDFDRFSWESFVALNWSPDNSGTIGQNGDNATVWETYKNVYDVFLPYGKDPGPWNTPAQVPDACKGYEGMVISQVGKTPDLLTGDEQPFKTGPLIDQNGVYTRFQIVINEEMFDYIRENQLYSFDAQQKFKQPAVFPEGNMKKQVWGAIMIKSSWKVLGEGDDASRFHTTKALVYTPASENPVVPESCTEQTVGLVGLHIGTKTEICPQWIWSTFEQVDNAPTFGDKKDKAHYNYYKNGAPTAINEAPARPWNPNTPGQTPTQVERLTPIFKGTVALNKEYQQALRDVNPASVWQYYELVGTQWPVTPEDLPLGNPFPEFLANATLETYVQGIVKNGEVELVPNVSSSCMHCHNGATMKANGYASDFTFLLERAQ